MEYGPPSTLSEREILSSILAQSGKLWPFLRLWRNNTGVGRPLTGEYIVRYGLPGSSDLIGILNDGRFLAIECKSRAGKLSRIQHAFRRMIESQGGVYILACSIEDVTEGLRAYGYLERRP